MTQYVFDTSVVAKFFLDEIHSETAMLVLRLVVLDQIWTNLCSHQQKTTN